jgi:hypothetical protein
VNKKNQLNNKNNNKLKVKVSSISFKNICFKLIILFDDPKSFSIINILFLKFCGIFSKLVQKSKIYLNYINYN